MYVKILVREYVCVRAGGATNVFLILLYARERTFASLSAFGSTGSFLMKRLPSMERERLTKAVGSRTYLRPSPEQIS